MTPLSGCRLVPAVADVDRIVVVNEGWLRLGVLVEGILLGEDPRHVRVDLRVILKLTQLEDVGGVNHDDRLRRGLLRQLDHVLLGTRQLEVALAVLEVRVLLGVVRVAEVRVVSHLLIDIARQVEFLATGAGDRHDRRITEGCGLGEQVVRILVLRGFRQRPIGLEHADLGALSAVGGVQVRQLIVRGEASVVEAVQEGGHRIVLRQRGRRCWRAPAPRR